MGVTKKDKVFQNRIDERRQKIAERLNKRILSSDVASVSSNHKWTKVFECLEVQLPSNTDAEVKLLMERESFPLFEFMSSCFENEYFDGPHGGFLYKELEWVKLPIPSSVDFDIQVDYERQDDAIKIYGYRVSNS